MANFDTVYNSDMKTYFKTPYPAPMFAANYPQVTPAGQMGDFFVNTYFLRPDRRQEIPGPIPVRQLKVMSTCNSNNESP